MTSYPEKQPYRLELLCNRRVVIGSDPAKYTLIKSPASASRIIFRILSFFGPASCMSIRVEGVRRLVEKHVEH